MVGDGTEESLDMGTDSIGADDSGDDTGASRRPRNLRIAGSK